MKILGIDPGSRRCGYGVVELRHRFHLIAGGVIEISAGELPTQLKSLTAGITQILSRYPVDEVALEDIFFAYNPKSVIKLAQFRGAIGVKILEYYPTFYQYTPLQVKRALTGNGKASKEQVSFMVRRILGIGGEIKPLDISDALAIAITHGQRRKSGVL